MNAQQPNQQPTTQAAEVQQYKQELAILVGLLTEIRDMAMQFSMLLPKRTQPLLERVNAKLRTYGR